MFNKKVISLTLGAAMVVGLLSGCAAGGSSDSSSAQQETNRIEVTEAVQETEESADLAENTEIVESAEAAEDSDASGKTLVVYYSAQGHTVNFAEAIADELDADLFELIPVEPYSEDDLNWRDTNSRVSIEHDDESLRDIELVSTTVENWESYDTVYIGYPIWWGIAAWPVDNFVRDNDFTGKTVIPFATSSSSGLGESGEILADYAGTGDWLEGRRFQSNEDVANAREWAASLAQ